MNIFPQHIISYDIVSFTTFLEGKSLDKHIVM